MLTRQLVDLATKLPEYKSNIVTKMHAFELPKGGRFTKLSQTLDELKQELPGGTAPVAPTITQEPEKPESAFSSPPSLPPPAVPVQVIETSKANPLELVQVIVAPLLGPLGMAALVLVLVICMLFQREDLRNRLIRLIGQGRISATTRAMDDAGQRVSRYLLMQLLVNVTYGTVIAIGLYFIGVPNAVLWGAFGTVLRFIPYIGPWVATPPHASGFGCLAALTLPDPPSRFCRAGARAAQQRVELLPHGARRKRFFVIAMIVARLLIGVGTAAPPCRHAAHRLPQGGGACSLAFRSSRVVLSDEDAPTPAEDCYHRLPTPGERDANGTGRVLFESELADRALRLRVHPGAHPAADRCPRAL
jgi:hypothetical protein